MGSRTWPSWDSLLITGRRLPSHGFLWVCLLPALYHAVRRRSLDQDYGKFTGQTLPWFLPAPCPGPLPLSLVFVEVTPEANETRWCVMSSGTDVHPLWGINLTRFHLVPLSSAQFGFGRISPISDRVTNFYIGLRLTERPCFQSRGQMSCCHWLRPVPICCRTPVLWLRSVCRWQ